MHGRGVDTNPILRGLADPWPSGHNEGEGAEWGCAPSCVKCGSSELYLFKGCSRASYRIMIQNILHSGVGR